MNPFVVRPEPDDQSSVLDAFEIVIAESIYHLQHQQLLVDDLAGTFIGQNTVLFLSCTLATFYRLRRERNTVRRKLLQEGVGRPCAESR